MTVKELAKYLKLSEMMVYKLAQSGQMPASKIGSAWRFSEKAIDDWLSKTSAEKPPFPEPVSSVLADFVAGLKNKFGENFYTIFVYGSYARGDAKEGSDIDVLVVLDDAGNYGEMKRVVRDIAYDVSFGKGRAVVLSAMLMSRTEFETSESPTLLNIKNEGIEAA
jgi:excisionase family DNA binding protein